MCFYQIIIYLITVYSQLCILRHFTIKTSCNKYKNLPVSLKTNLFKRLALLILSTIIIKHIILCVADTYRLYACTITTRILSTKISGQS